MPSSHRSGSLRRSAITAMLLGALPLSLPAQVRRPDPVPSGPRAAAKAQKHRTDILKGGGFINLDEANATKAMMFVGSTGFRRQFSPRWLYLGAAIDLGHTSIDGEFFPYEKRPVGDSIQYVVVDGSAVMAAGRVTVEALFPLDDAERFRAGLGGNAGMYAMFPKPAAGSGAGSFVAPTFGAAFVGQADLTEKFGIAASLGFTQFTNFDREKLRPSDPALADPVFLTPLVPPPAAVKSFGGARVIISMSYRLGVKKTTGGKK
jgi:hypothetical protein